MEILKKATLKNAWFWVFAIVSIILLSVSLIMPPTGAIDASVIHAVGELFGFATLGVIVKAIDKGIDAKIKHKDTEIDLKND